MVSKRTVNELLKDYMEDKMIDDDTMKDVLKQLHKNIGKAEDGDEVEGSKSKVSHGTSCPRIMTKTGDLIVEM